MSYCCGIHDNSSVLFICIPAVQLDRVPTANCPPPPPPRPLSPVTRAPCPLLKGIYGERSNYYPSPPAPSLSPLKPGRPPAVPTIPAATRSLHLSLQDKQVPSELPAALGSALASRPTVVVELKAEGNSADAGGALLVPVGPSPFHRLLLHALCQYRRLRSRSEFELLFFSCFNTHTHTQIKASTTRGWTEVEKKET